MPSRSDAPARPGRGEQRDIFGRTIGGKYIVRSVLGEGGMGTVYEAEHVAIGRSVAIKVLHPQQARRNVAVTRFYQEARAAGSIGHPNICEVYDLGELEDGSPYLVMERLVGDTLADRIARSGGLPFHEVIDILMQVLAGLVVAHDTGIVHRDIKPENVFLTKPVGCPMTAKILDFGISKSVTHDGHEEEMHLTRTGMVMGTPFYMSPEQARGDRDLDARVDLYACGVILYEALSGRRPFVAPNYNALLLQILSGAPRPLHEVRPDVPHELARIAEKAMRRARVDRYQSALEFQEDLQRILHPPRVVPHLDLSELAPPPARLASRRPETGRHPRARAGSGAVPVPRSPRRSDPPADYAERVPPSAPPTSIEIPVDFESSGRGPAVDEFDDFDNMPTEIHSPGGSRPPPAPPPRRPVSVPAPARAPAPAPGSYGDDDDSTSTVVRQDALAMIRAARTGAQPVAEPEPFNPDETVRSARDENSDKVGSKRRGKPRR
jgi:serine/threonine protein kinase